jgi:rhodanese-related sulfurtransferase
MEKITYEQLKDMQTRNVPIINVLAAEAFAKANISGSVNVPGESPDFAQRVEKQIGGKDKSVVVYCASSSCPASKEAAEKLEKAGFTQVKCYEGGTAEWQQKSGSREAA